ncbi:Putative 10 TMS drug/metabolite exporter, DME family, DMT superfamily [Candidatus Koribacter versatilis Ellin345]|uniref:10 TMS drug/metabolite exporter, DME family, DMT superfamily n=1 Tax=Koribacter versatilis (strain Ellin345) TaxID=204669 RepID=Q1II14_KORVE|nr:EamA family transporter [Candidatus Koribacter versatilis]ABF43486.1 Putative 10 TMS drug/metabolite exporter, DME family, DMT superfamily [Candidatus Koribacter versatilis Ellin345]
MNLSTQTSVNTAPTRGSAGALAITALVLSGCCWGTGFLFGKIALEQMSVTENVAWRFIFGSLGLLPIIFLRWQPYTRRDWVSLLIASFVGVPIQFLIQFKGLQLTTVSHASLMIGTLPIMLAMSSVIFLGERLHWQEWFSLAIATFGAVLIALSHGNGVGSPQASVVGDVLVVLSLLAAVVMVMITKKLIGRHDSLHVTSMMIVLGTLMLIPWAVLTHPMRFDFSTSTWIGVAAQGFIATSGAYLLWNWGLAKVPASRAGVFLNMEPLVGALLGVTVLHEHLGWPALLGGAMVVGAAIHFSKTS